MAGDPIISTRDHPGEYDGLVSAKPGEPLFHLQGGDPFGPATVLHWAGLARAAALAEENQDKADALLRKATNAEQVAWRMQAYQAGEVEQPGVSAKYSEAPPPPITADADERAARIRVAGRLHNLIGEGAGLIDQLAALGEDMVGLPTLRSAIAEMKDAARVIEPRTGREQT